ncbi:DUF2892 domain-containing protein [Alicyclobacillaceae bacterium I2511]|nr:DUF2892 domain-containing protein [Alicyclobacillaceae bacterium I2511]
MDVVFHIARGPTVNTELEHPNIKGGIPVNSDSHSHSQSQTQFTQHPGPQPNINRVDRYIRLTSGIVLLAVGLQQRRRLIGKTVLLSFGASKVAEGVTGWCPLTYLMNTLSTSIHENRNHELVSPDTNKTDTSSFLKDEKSATSQNASIADDVNTAYH